MALVIAIAVLAALLFLGLPFLFSQSSSLAGARAAGWGGAAERARRNGDQMAVGAAAYAQGLHWSPEMARALHADLRVYSELPSDLHVDAGSPGESDDTGRFIFSTVDTWPCTPLPSWLAQQRPPLDDSGNGASRSGAAAEDQQGRADPNAFSPEAWGRMLKELEISDPPTCYWNWYGDGSAANPSPGTVMKPGGSFGEWKWATYGRLALGLYRNRVRLEGGRVVYLEQLLAAKPECPNPEFNASGGSLRDPHGNPLTGVPRSDGALLPTRSMLDGVTPYRNVPLIRSELERLRPYLSLDVPGQGRGGWVDQGSVVAAYTNPGSGYIDALIDGLGSAGRSQGTYTFVVRTADGVIAADWGNDWYVGNGGAVASDPAVLEVSPILNINTLVRPGTKDPLARILGLPAQTRPITSLDRIDQWGLINPAAGDGATISNPDGTTTAPVSFERPSAGVTSLGIIAVDSAGMARDPQGNAQAQHSRRAIVQAVPQEHALQATWKNQAEIESLLRQRHGSWMVSGPKPAMRVSGFVAGPGVGANPDGFKGGDLQDNTGNLPDGWLEPGPIGSFQACGASPVDWAASFGLKASQPWTSVLNEERGSGQVPTDLAGAPLDPKTVLGPQGLNLGGSFSMAWKLVGGGGAGLLKFNTLTGYASDEMAGRCISVSFCLTAAPSAGSEVVLLEARAPAGNGALTGLPAGATADGTALWRVHYVANAGDGMLVLAIANLARPWTSAVRTANATIAAWTMAADDAATPSIDERCLPGTKDFAAAVSDAGYQDRVEFRYRVKGGLAAGTWHRLQVVCAGDRPGTHALILDGVVGRDAIAAQDFSKTGDHYTFPSLRLASAISMTTPRTVGSAALSAPDIEVWTPPDPASAAMLPITKVLPTRGIIRVDDEFFSYEDVDVTSTPQKLKDVQRARRVNTNQAASATVVTDSNGNVLPVNLAWPVTQEHAVGALVVPGWSQIPVSGSWLRGHGTTHDAFPFQKVTGMASTAGWPDTVTLDNAAAWPEQGYVRFGNGAQAAYLKSSGSTFALDWVPPETAPTAAPVGTVSATLISLRIQDGDDFRFAPSGAVQLLDAADHGRIEWIRYTATADRSGRTVAGLYFLQTDGWPVPIPPGNALGQTRGAYRTAYRKDDWPALTVVLPVQTGFGGTSRFEDGDVVTVVPAAIQANPPWQIIVRHACRDGYPLLAADSGSIYDTINEYFALAAAVPAQVIDPATSPNQIFLIGRGWGGDDLSVTGNYPTRMGQMPRIAGFQTLPTSADARILVGTPASGNGLALVVDDLVAGEPPWNGDYNAPGGCSVIQIGGSTSGSISATGVADLPLLVQANQRVFPSNRWYGLVQIDDEVFAYRRVDDSNAQLIARSLLGSAPASHALPSAAPIVLPYREVRPTLPLLVLPVGPVAELATTLGNPAAPETKLDLIDEDPTAYANRFTASGNRFQNPDHTAAVLNAPYQLIQSADGGQSEVTRLFHLPYSKFATSAVWLRGLFGTTNQTWTALWTVTSATGYGTSGSVMSQAPGSLNPIVIGWWPRFAAAVPDGIAGADFSRFVRSRSASWAGFPMRLHGMRMDPAIPALATAGGVADVTVLADGGCRLAARALAGQDNTGSVRDNLLTLFAWDQAYEWPLTIVGTTPSNVAPASGTTAPFGWGAFHFHQGTPGIDESLPVDGAEMRIYWKYPGAGSDLRGAAAVQGCCPRLGTVNLRCVAPVRIISVEGAR